MVSDLDIWRSAQLLINQHGDNAELVACLRLDQLIGRGDPAGEAAWERILTKVRELQSATTATVLH